jgi:predicted Zn-dependent protease with MMP-like domain
MIAVSAERFDELLDQALADLPAWVIARMDNVVVEAAPWPTRSQQQRARRAGLLLGLYEGVPLSRRGRGYHLAPPDRITLFSMALQYISDDEPDLVRHIQRTVAHEIGHHFGMSEQELHDAGV